MSYVGVGLVPTRLCLPASVGVSLGFSYPPTANDSASGTIVTVGWVERDIEITRLGHRKLYIFLRLNTQKHQRNPTLSLTPKIKIAASVSDKRDPGKELSAPHR